MSILFLECLSQLIRGGLGDVGWGLGCGAVAFLILERDGSAGGLRGSRAVAVQAGDGCRIHDGRVQSHQLNDGLKRIDQRLTRFCQTSKEAQRGSEKKGKTMRNQGQPPSKKNRMSGQGRSRDLYGRLKPNQWRRRGDKIGMSRKQEAAGAAGNNATTVVGMNMVGLRQPKRRESKRELKRRR